MAERIGNFVSSMWRAGVHEVEGFQMWHWYVGFTALVIFGVMCMRGLSSKTNY